MPKKRDPKPPKNTSGIKEYSSSKQVKFNEAALVAMDKLYKSDFQTFFTRPKIEAKGLYIILRWYPRYSTWVTLYLGYGDINTDLSRLIISRDTLPLGKYLSSFPDIKKKKLLWLKWLIDPELDENISNKAIPVIKSKYNHGCSPPFNFKSKKTSKRSKKH